MTFAAHRQPNGFIVVTVLWLVAALATLAAIYAGYVLVTAAGLSDYDDRIRAQASALAGVEMAAHHLTANPRERPARGAFSFRANGFPVQVEFHAENGRVDLNFASRDMLARLLGAAGADNPELYADRIVAARSPPSGADGDEAFARSVGRSFGPRRGPFQHVSEIALLGLPPAAVDRALPYLTVFSGQAAINPLAASMDVLRLLPGLTQERIATLIEQRGNAPQDILNAQLGPAAQYVTFLTSRANRVTVTVPFPPNRRLTVQAVVLVTEDGAQPYRVLGWAERTD